STVSAVLLTMTLGSMNTSLCAAEGKVKSSDSTTINAASTSNDRTLGQVQRAEKVIGKRVDGSDGEKLGKIDDLVVDLQSGRIYYAIVSSGGVLGAGEKKRAVPPELFTVSDENFRLNADKQKFNSAPEFTREMDKSLKEGQGDFAKNVYTYFGQRPWWEGGTAATATGNLGNAVKFSDVKGMKVENSSNQTIGKIEDGAVDLPAARLVFVIFSPDRSLDLDGNLFALPPSSVTLSGDQKHLVGDFTKDKLSAAPHFAKDNWPDMSNPAWASQVYQYYGKQAYFE